MFAVDKIFSSCLESYNQRIFVIIFIGLDFIIIQFVEKIQAFFSISIVGIDPFVRKIISNELSQTFTGSISISINISGL